MAHDFLGTFNKSQFERFISFARSQLTQIEGRIQHLQAEQNRMGSLRFTFGVDNIPTAVTATPNTSYIAKLLAAYEVLGGNPFIDLRARTRTQALHILKGSEGAPAQIMSNGEPLTQKGLLDAFSAELVHEARGPLQETLSRRFEGLERKIRRALDYSDSLAQEIAELQVHQAAATLDGSLEYIATQIQELFGDRGYRAIYDDSNADPLGINTYAPYSAFDAEAPEDPALGPDKAAPGPQRQDSGFVGPGEKA